MEPTRALKVTTIPRPVVCGITLLLNGPVQLFMDGDDGPSRQEFALLEPVADGLRESVVFFPGWRNGNTAIEICCRQRLPRNRPRQLAGHTDPALPGASRGHRAAHAPEGVAPCHGADGGVVLLHLLPADILEFGPAEVRVLLENPEEVSCLNGNVLPDIADKQDASVPGLSDTQERGTHLDWIAGSTRR